jgi:hypothetical protein
MLTVKVYNNIGVVEKRVGLPDAGASSPEAGEVAL